MWRRVRFKWGSAPNPVFGGNYFLGRTDRKEKILKFRTPSTLERRTPVLALG